MYIINSDGSGKTRVADASASEPVFYYSPRLSQDGSKIVVLSSRGNCGGACTINAQGIPSPLQVWVMNADGSQAKPLTHIIDADPYIDPALSPALSPDGSKVVYSDTYGVTLMDVNSLAQTRFGNERYAFPYASPSFSPDGTKILYSYEGIFTANTDGTGKTRIVDEGMEPSFSPDGSQITYTTYLPHPDSDGFSLPPSCINIVNTDGTGQRRLTFGADVSYSPSFSKDGKNIIFKVRDNSFNSKLAHVVTMNLDGSNQTSVAIEGQ